MPWNRPLIIVLLLALLALAWWRQQPQEQEIRSSRLMMGTIVEIVAAGGDPGKLEAAVDAAFTEMTRLERLLSRYLPESDVSRLAESRKEVKIAPETAEVIALGLEVAKRSGGAFDLTLGRVKSLWGFDEEAPGVPEPEALAEALAGIGPDALTLNGLQVNKRSAALVVDLGGVAKGYIVDRAVAVLKQQGVASAAVNAGGDMYLLGLHKQRPWRIGIQHPRQKETLIETVEVRDRAVVTSGDYERFFDQDGQRYHHIFDPNSGYPAGNCQSVTIMTDSVALGDALATAVFVLGPEAGLQLLGQYPGTEGLVIAADGSRSTSPGWPNHRAAQ